MQINFNELMNFIQGTGISLQQRFLGYQRRDINGIFEFFDTLQNALLTNVKRAFVNVRFFSISIHLSILACSCTHLNRFGFKICWIHPSWMPMERNNYINFMQCTGLLELTDLTQTKAMKSSEWIKLLYDNMVMIRTLKIQALA